jgi:hypothetical protein
MFNPKPIDHQVPAGGRGAGYHYGLGRATAGNHSSSSAARVINE